jgi:hypothetical protein
MALLRNPNPARKTRRSIEMYQQRRFCSRSNFDSPSALVRLLKITVTPVVEELPWNADGTQIYREFDQGAP